MPLSLLSEKGRALLAHDTAEAMRTELELSAAATMEPQSDIRDRTGRLALSGMYGFGQAFTSAEALSFNGQAYFVMAYSHPGALCGQYCGLLHAAGGHHAMLPVSLM